MEFYTTNEGIIDLCINLFGDKIEYVIFAHKMDAFFLHG